jgi:hypothetical protein|tara:strand:+ start:30359 stop:30475 length:117 start_codon:yes stop_codon:yes gene_type:complete
VAENLMMIAMAVWMLAMCGGARRGVHDVDGLESGATCA